MSELGGLTVVNNQVAAIILFLFGSFVIGWGWWDAHYGERPVWKGLAVTSIGMCLNVFAVVIFLAQWEPK